MYYITKGNLCQSTLYYNIPPKTSYTCDFQRKPTPHPQKSLLDKFSTTLNFYKNSHFQLTGKFLSAKIKFSSSKLTTKKRGLSTFFFLVVGVRRLSWICSTLEKFRYWTFGSVRSISSLSGINAIRKSAEPTTKCVLILTHSVKEQIVWLLETDSLRFSAMLFKKYKINVKLVGENVSDIYIHFFTLFFILSNYLG